MSSAVQDIDQPLYQDTRWLARTLGQVILRLEGQQVFDAVEDLRDVCHKRRAHSPDAPSLKELLGRVEQMPLEIAAPVARAFTLFFLLINTAEQVHRVRRRQQYGRSHQNSSQPASIRWAFEQLKQMGMSSSEVREAVSKVRARPVLTAHPTEAT